MTSEGFLNLRQIIAVVVMVQLACVGHGLGNSPHRLDKNLLGIYQTSAGHLQMPPRCPADAPLMPCGCFFPEGTRRTCTGHLGVACRYLSDKIRSFTMKNSAGHLQVISRASGGGLQMPLQDCNPVLIGQCPKNYNSELKAPGEPQMSPWCVTIDR